MLQARLVVLALLATAWSCCGEFYPIKQRRRTRAAKCFDDPQDEVKPLAYGGGKSVSIAYQDWSSSRVTSEITYILLSEVMGYKSHLLDTATLFDQHPVRGVSYRRRD